jgi:hypothetical protein
LLSWLRSKCLKLSCHRKKSCGHLWGQSPHCPQN